MAQSITGASSWPRVCIVGPLPPPSGGMANQCEQLLRLLGGEGAEVQLVCTNAPYRPAFIGRVPVLRAAFRLLPYLAGLWRALGRAEVAHVFANSGWAWHLLAAPAIVIARLRGIGIVVHYHGGQADEFFSQAPGHVLKMLGGVRLRVTPSVYLQRVFARHGLSAQVIPNSIDLSRFGAQQRGSGSAAPHLIVTRNLEQIYDIPTAIRAFARVRAVHPQARMSIAGSGPERDALAALIGQLGLIDSVRLCGRIDNAEIARLYAQADVMLNPSTVDNMPISILEALACGVPVVSTDAGGIPDMVRHDVCALLVPVGDDRAMADSVLRVLDEPGTADRLRHAGLAEAQHYAWPHVKLQWQAAYQHVAQSRSAT